MTFAPERFTVTEQHLALLRRANVGWEDCEFGAPAIDCKRPYGNSDVLADMADILGLDWDDTDDAPNPELSDQADRLTRLHRETQTALQIALATGQFSAGTYEAPAYTNRWRRARVTGVLHPRPLAAGETVHRPDCLALPCDCGAELRRWLETEQGARLSTEAVAAAGPRASRVWAALVAAFDAGERAVLARQGGTILRGLPTSLPAVAEMPSSWASPDPRTE